MIWSFGAVLLIRSGFSSGAFGAQGDELGAFESRALCGAGDLALQFDNLDEFKGIILRLFESNDPCEGVPLSDQVR